MTKVEKPPERELKGWKAIAAYLGQPVATAQRWAKSGMPVTQNGRYVVSKPEGLKRWLGHESGISAPVEIASAETDSLVPELKRGLANARKDQDARRRR